MNFLLYTVEIKTDWHPYVHLHTLAIALGAEQALFWSFSILFSPPVHS